MTNDTHRSVLTSQVSRAKLRDAIFAAAALLAMFSGLLTLGALIAALLIDGGHRLSWEFLS